MPMISTLKKAAKKVATKKTTKVVKKAVVKKTTVKKAAVKKPVAKPRIRDNMDGFLAGVEQAAAEAAVIALQEPEVVKEPEKRDFTEAKKKYRIEDPDKIKWAPRTEFIQGLCAAIKDERPIEDLILEIPVKPGEATDSPSYLLRELAGEYRVLRMRDARLPKFGKWVSSMFQQNQDLQRLVSQAGQGQAKGKALIVSDDIIDILRCADTPHYWSCLNAGGTFKEVPVAICEQTPGIFIAYIDGDDDKMRGRVWLHHGKLEDGRDVVIAASHIYGNGITMQQLADYFADRGVELYRSNAYGGYGGKPVNAKYHQCFTKSLHYDTRTWDFDGKVTVVKVAPTNRLKNAA